MKAILPSTAAAVSLVAAMLASVPALGQQAPAGGPAPTVAVVDLDLIFKQHAKFQAMKEDMKRDVDRAEGEVKNQNEEIKRLAGSLEQFKPGTNEYKDLETRLATMQAKLQIDVQQRKKEFMLQEAKIYHQTYREISEEIRSYADRAGISIVLRVADNEPVDENDPQAVLEEFKKLVVHNHPSLNITQPILANINRRNGVSAPPANRTAGPPAQPGVRPGAPQAGQPPQVGTRPAPPNPPRTR